MEKLFAGLEASANIDGTIYQADEEGFIHVENDKHIAILTGPPFFMTSAIPDVPVPDPVPVAIDWEALPNIAERLVAAGIGLEVDPQAVLAVVDKYLATLGADAPDPADAEVAAVRAELISLGVSFPPTAKLKALRTILETEKQSRAAQAAADAAAAEPLTGPGSV